jgi:hypothetical protein
MVPPAMMELLAAVARHRPDPASVPGLAALLPDCPLLAWLNDGEVVSSSRLFVIAGDAEGDDRRSWLKTLISDAYYWTDNDLIVGTRSMYGGVPRHAGGRFLLDQGSRTQHFGYFGHPHTAQAITAALLEESPAGFRTIGPLSWAGKDSGGTR